MATFDVLLPVKNALPYLPEAIDSICNQSFRDWRLHILDHGSVDGSLALALARAEEDRRITVHAVPGAGGLSGLLNHGLALCDCKYVLRQDADDISMPERMAVLFDVLENDPGLALAGSRAIMVDAQRRRTGLVDVPLSHEGILAAMPFRTAVTHPSVAMRLTALDRLGARYGVDFLKRLPPDCRLEVPGLAEDYFLFGQLALAARCINVDRNLIEYRWHGANVGGTRYVEQMQVSLKISRYLADTMAAMSGTARFDPAPFCNHGQNLFAIDGKLDFREEYEAMQRILRTAIRASSELDRELSFRRVIALRTTLAMARRYLSHAARHGLRASERNTVRSWALRPLKKRWILRLTPTGLATWAY